MIILILEAFHRYLYITVSGNKSPFYNKDVNLDIFPFSPNKVYTNNTIIIISSIIIIIIIIISSSIKVVVVVVVVAVEVVVLVVVVEYADVH